MEQQTVDGITAYLVSLAPCGCGISKGGLKYEHEFSSIKL